ncbi:hypothetical protein ACHAWF_009764, partial [Thalassiosira exigua]
MSSPLSDEHAARLKAIGLDLNTRRDPKDDAHWDRMCANLADYREEHGHCYVPHRYRSKEVGNLGDWVWRMRKDGAEGKLSVAREAKLTKLGFDFRKKSSMEQRSNEKWEKQFKELLEYKTSHGEYPRFGKNTRLGGWYRRQQILYNNGKLSRDRVERLRGAGFDLDILKGGAKAGDNVGSKSQQWNEMYGQLVLFFEDHGHCDIGEDNPRLKTWLGAMQNSSELTKVQKHQLMLLKALKDGSEKYSMKCAHPEGCEKFAVAKGRCHSHFPKPTCNATGGVEPNERCTETISMSEHPDNSTEAKQPEEVSLDFWYNYKQMLEDKWDDRLEE